MEILQLVNFGKGLKGSRDFQMVMIPGTFQNLDGLSFWNADLAPIQEYLNAHFRGSLKDPTPEVSVSTRRLTVSIFDGCGKRLAVQEARRRLESSGYAIREIKRTENQAETQVIVQRGDLAKAESILEALGVGKKVEASLGDIYSDFTVILGADWKDSKPAEK
jgi:hypothetical protein